MEGISFVNVAARKGNLGNVYQSRAIRAQAANDLDRCISNLELALPHLREAARIFRAINHVDSADRNLRAVAEVEEYIRKIRIVRVAAASAATNILKH